MNTLRAAFRLVLLVGLVLGSLPFGLACRNLTRRMAWMQQLSRRLLRLFGARVRVAGAIPLRGLVVCNHLGYLDVLAIGAVCPAIFVAKSDVRAWPAIGFLCRIAGTIFVRRDRRTAVAETTRDIARVLDAGVPVVLFPEGTSSDGSSVLPFKTALLAAAERFPFTTAAISYELPGGSVADELCYWRDMTFAPHFWNVLGKPGFEVRLRFGESHVPCADRKHAALLMRDGISTLLKL
jgi:1-acyl-sn-glycerol-3-phosphate acyltransferase